MDDNTTVFWAWVLIILFFISLFYWVAQTDLMVLPEGHSFCDDKGYSSVSIGGSYEEMFGKVTCSSCYNGECKTEEFNVVKRFGIIIEDKIQTEGVQKR